jgi:D-beta-D-heptose 7-phosphate kinase/D-beta-D-heptose 1-phosphate adenosyltransferase
MMSSSSDLPGYLEAFAKVRILCLGDIMLDRFVYGHVDRVSQEAPIPIMRSERQEAMLGGAGNVARNVQALGGHVTLVGLAGDDQAGEQVRNLAADIANLDLTLIVDDNRPTTLKTRYLAAGQQLLRVDEENRSYVSPALEAALLDAYANALPDCDLVILSDYAKGCFTDHVLAQAIELARNINKPIIADPKRLNMADYAGITMLKPNRTELAAATGLPCESDEQVTAAAGVVLQDANITALLVSRSEHGISLITKDAPPLHLPALARQVFDVSGAGDTVVATAAMALAAGASLAQATTLASHAGSIVVAKSGTAVVTPGELADALQQADFYNAEATVMGRVSARERVQRWRAAGLKVGFTNGCFDLLHPGHVALLEDAKSYCDRLIVAINTDASVTRLKGEGRPLQDEESRALMLAAMTAVDMVVVFGEDDPVALLELFRLDVLVKGGDYDLDGIVGADLVLGYGGEVHVSRLVAGRSSTDLIKKMSGDDE